MSKSVWPIIKKEKPDLIYQPWGRFIPYQNKNSYMWWKLMNCVRQIWFHKHYKTFSEVICTNRIKLGRPKFPMVQKPIR